MPEVHAFRALRYAAAVVAGDPDGLLAPPYDVIGEAEAEELRARHPYNAVRLELPEGGDPGRYELAARRVGRWLERGVLTEDASPAAYVYRQAFPFGGEALERRSLIAGLRLEALDAGGVLPHEETHGEPKRDRLALALACRAQLSPVFLLAPDPDGALLAGLREGEGTGELVLDATTGDGVRHRLVRLDAAAEDTVNGDRAVEAICRAAGAAPLLIADGHHRYETALAVAGKLPDSEAATSVLACIVPEGDPGVLLRPTHRALHLPPPDVGWADALRDWFAIRPARGGRFPIRPARAEEWARALPAGSGEMAVLPAGSAAAMLHAQARPEALRQAGISGPGARIPALAFDRLVVRRLLGQTAEELARRGSLTYHRDAREAAEAAAPDGAAFLMAPTRPADVRDAVAGGGRLPPKTTYFWPKVPAGLLFRRI